MTMIKKFIQLNKIKLVAIFLLFILLGVIVWFTFIDIVNYFIEKVKSITGINSDLVVEIILGIIVAVIITLLYGNLKWAWLIAIFLFSYCMIITETVQVAENKFWVMLLQYSSVLGAISSLFLVLLGLYVVKEKKKDESNNE